MPDGSSSAAPAMIPGPVLRANDRSDAAASSGVVAAPPGVRGSSGGVGREVRGSVITAHACGTGRMCLRTTDRDNRNFSVVVKEISRQMTRDDAAIL